MFELHSAVTMGKPLVTCCVEPGFWKGWGVGASGARSVPDDHELARLARLSTHLFAVLGEASRVHWASEGAVTPAERCTLQLPEALPRLLRLLSESRAALKADEEAAVLQLQKRQLNLSLRAKALAAVEAATAESAAANARLNESEATAERRKTDARRKAEAARLAHVAAAAEMSAAAMNGADDNATSALERVFACQSVLNAAKAEEKRVTESEALRVVEVRAALAASVHAREKAVDALAATPHEDTML